MWNALGQRELLGCICLKLQIKGEPSYTLFYVANESKILESVILGRTWMRSNTCQLDWENRTDTIQVNSQTLIGSSLDGIQDLLNEKEILTN